MTKNTAIEIRQVNGHLELFLHTDLDGSFQSTKEGIPIVNPIEGFRLLRNTIDRFHWVDRNDIDVLWENAEGKRGSQFSDVALIDPKTKDYDAWLIAEVIVGRPSKITNSAIGSTHWFRTIISQHSRVGEYLMNEASSEIKPHLLESWGKGIYESSRELINWSDRSKTLTNE